jgi:hypothetical protein
MSELNSEMYRDSNGVVRWASNDRMVPESWLTDVKVIEIRNATLAEAKRKVDAGREFKRGCRDMPWEILKDTDVDYSSLSIAQKMHVIIELADDVRSLSERDEFTEQHSENLFRFINEQLTWEEAVVFTNLLSKTFHISFTRLRSTGSEQFIQFAEKHRHYLRGSV